MLLDKELEASGMDISNKLFIFFLLSHLEEELESIGMRALLSQSWSSDYKVFKPVGVLCLY
jgi:hypothetical protein